MKKVLIQDQLKDLEKTPARTPDLACSSPPKPREPSMADLSIRSLVGTTLLVAILTVGPGSGRAEAQVAYGFGLNGNVIPFYTPGFGPSPETQYLYSRSESLNAHYEAVLREHSRNNAANPRDFKHFARESPGQWPQQRRARTPAGASPGPASTAPPESSNPLTLPTVELSSFLGSDGHVDWPRDVPGSPELDAKRGAADEAIRSAAAEIREGKLTVRSVDLARERLIAFGQPSLAKVRAERSARVAESFHSYLRQLLQAVEHSVPVKAEEAQPVASLPG